MTNHPDPRVPPESTADPDARTLSVSVARAGGVAGVTRRWQVSAPPQESAHWIPLVERCPWDAAGTAGDSAAPTSAAPVASRGADRFTWTIEARIDGRSHRAIVSEAEAQGAWRALIDAVRAATPSAR